MNTARWIILYIPICTVNVIIKRKCNLCALLSVMKSPLPPEIFYRTNIRLKYNCIIYESAVGIWSNMNIYTTFWIKYSCFIISYRNGFLNLLLFLNDEILINLILLIRIFFWEFKSSCYKNRISIYAMSVHIMLLDSTHLKLKF